MVYFPPLAAIISYACIALGLMLMSEGTFLLCIQIEEVDLKPKGKDIPVTEMNKKEYVEYGICFGVGSALGI